ncbi:hypothetical protein [Streptomyces sp. NPDC003717]|uniref:hypothetical protein n=1 Tax=Streptomyces sp. NPDC003717 TaxID=3154276 RepID=UPI0033ACAAC6
MTAPASHALADLSDVVAGPYTEPLTGERLVLVQDLGDHPTDPASLDRLRHALHTRHPEATATLLRVARPATPHPPWRRHLTYVRCPDPAALPDPGPHPPIRPAAGPADDEQVRAWLAQAFVNGGADSGTPVPPDTARDIAADLYRRPGRVSLVAQEPTGRLLGHATVLTGAADETTGETYGELVDILIAPGEPVGPLTAALSRAAALHCHAQGQPLVGNVVHTPCQDPAAGGRDTWRIVTRLLAHGWRLDHEYWRAEAPRPGETP